MRIDYAAILPEAILAIGATVLMLVAAAMGRKSTALVSWSAVGLLIAATIALIGAPSDEGRGRRFSTGHGTREKDLTVHKK